MKKIIGLLKVKNESDIIESCVRYTLAYCDSLLVYDNGSFDETGEIIRKLAAEGLAVVFLNDWGVSRSPDKELMAALAVNEYGADLVLSLDADEFLGHADGTNPRHALEALPEDTEFQIPWRTYIYEKEPDLGFLPNNFSHYRHPLLERVAGHAGLAVTNRYLILEKQSTFAPGSHWLNYPPEIQGSVAVKTHEKLFLAHFPARSRRQVCKKIIPESIHHMRDTDQYNTFEKIYADHQFGPFYKEFKEEGRISQEQIKRLSVEYSLYNLGSRRKAEKVMRELGGGLLVRGPLDVSFCAEKLKLRYTEEENDDSALWRSTLAAIEATVAALQKREKTCPCRRWQAKATAWLRQWPRALKMAKTLRQLFRRLGPPPTA